MTYLVLTVIPQCDKPAYKTDFFVTLDEAIAFKCRTEEYPWVLECIVYERKESDNHE